jgi:hypothetical protein
MLLFDILGVIIKIITAPCRPKSEPPKYTNLQRVAQYQSLWNFFEIDSQKMNAKDYASMTYNKLRVTEWLDFVDGKKTTLSDDFTKTRTFYDPIFFYNFTIGPGIAVLTTEACESQGKTELGATLATILQTYAVENARYFLNMNYRFTDEAYIRQLRPIFDIYEEDAVQNYNKACMAFYGKNVAIV